MRSTRSALRHARSVLAWFLLTLGVSVASPIVHPQVMQLVCSGGASKFVVFDADGTPTEVGRHALDCPLCLVTAPPATNATVGARPPQPLDHTASHPTAAPLAALVGAPLPPRGPPRLS